MRLAENNRKHSKEKEINLHAWEPPTSPVKHHSCKARVLTASSIERMEALHHALT